AAIFELQRHLARDLAIGHRGARPVEARRRREAGAAAQLAAAMLERHRAAGAAGLTEKIEPAPAIEAEAVRRLDDRAAARAARGQREIQHPARGERDKPPCRHVATMLRWPRSGKRPVDSRRKADHLPGLTDGQRRSAARWRSGYAEDCKSLHAGSIPARASIPYQNRFHFLTLCRVGV